MLARSCSGSSLSHLPQALDQPRGGDIKPGLHVEGLIFGKELFPEQRGDELALDELPRIGVVGRKKRLNL